MPVILSALRQTTALHLMMCPFRASDPGVCLRRPLDLCRDRKTVRNRESGIAKRQTRFKILDIVAHVFNLVLSKYCSSETSGTSYRRPHLGCIRDNDTVIELTNTKGDKPRTGRSTRSAQAIKAYRGVSKAL